MFVPRRLNDHNILLDRLNNFSFEFFVPPRAAVSRRP